MTSIDTILVCLFWTHSNNFQQNDVSMEVVKRGNITFPWIAEPYSETCQTLKMESYCVSGVLLLTLNRFYTRVLRVQFTLDIKHLINEFNVFKVSDKRPRHSGVFIASFSTYLVLVYLFLTLNR